MIGAGRRRGEPDEEFLQATMGCMDLVYNLARRCADTPEDAEDLVQETFLAAFRSWKSERRPDRVAAWMATICLNLCRSKHRTRARRVRESPLFDEMDPAATGRSIEEEVLVSLDVERLREAMDALPEPQRMAIVLVDLSGMSTARAAGAMDVPRGTVLSRLHRGRRALARMLDTRDDSEREQPADERVRDGDEREAQ